MRGTRAEWEVYGSTTAPTRLALMNTHESRRPGCGTIRYLATSVHFLYFSNFAAWVISHLGTSAPERLWGHSRGRAVQDGAWQRSPSRLLYIAVQESCCCRYQWISGDCHAPAPSPFPVTIFVLCIIVCPIKFNIIVRWALFLLATSFLSVCVYYCSTYYKAVRVGKGGAGEWRTSLSYKPLLRAALIYPCLHFRVHWLIPCWSHKVTKSIAEDTCLEVQTEAEISLQRKS